MALIVGLDPSLTHLGWIAVDTEKTGKDSVIEAGTFKTDPKDGLLVQRLIMQRERLKKLLIDHSINFIAMEAPYWGDASTEILFALNQFMHEVFLNLKIYVVYFQPITLKKFAVPDLNPHDVHKPHMVHQAKTELDRHGKRFSEHMADAFFAAKLGSLFYKWAIEGTIKDEDLSENERHIFCGKHTFVKGKKKGITEYTGIIYKENDQFFDYRKQTRNSESITKEVQNGTGKNTDHNNGTGKNTDHS
jgi:Holliday junction resolvasome RuvABC endonuclease subunit